MTSGTERMHRASCPGRSRVSTYEPPSQQMRGCHVIDMWALATPRHHQCQIMRLTSKHVSPTWCRRANNMQHTCAYISRVRVAECLVSLCDGFAKVHYTALYFCRGPCAGPSLRLEHLMENELARLASFLPLRRISPDDQPYEPRRDVSISPTPATASAGSSSSIPTLRFHAND